MVYDRSYVVEKKQDLVETLFGLSLPAQKQWELVGPPFPGEELMVDLYTYYDEMKTDYLHYGILEPEQCHCLDKLVAELEGRQKLEDAETFFLDPSQLETNEGWDIIRAMAKAALAALGYDSEKMKGVAEVELTTSGGKEVAIHRWRIVDGLESPDPES